MNITSIKYPDMFRSASTKTIAGSEATLQNLKTLLLTEKGSLFGDPYYGTNLKKLLFE
jgi:phage baseplate assembly protein W